MFQAEKRRREDWNEGVLLGFRKPPHSQKRMQNVLPLVLCK